MKRDSVSYQNIHSSIKDKKIRKANLEKFISRIEIDEKRGVWFSDYSGCPTGLSKNFLENRRNYIRRLKSEKSILTSLIKNHRADIDIAREVDEDFWKHDENYQDDRNLSKYKSSYTEHGPQKFGTVYALKNDYAPRIIKIGYTTRKLQKRFVEIANGAGVIPGYYYSLVIHCSNAPKLETIIHRRFRDARLSSDKEFFEIDEDSVIELVNGLTDSNINISYMKKNTNTE